MITLRELYTDNENFKKNDIYLSNLYNMFAGDKINQEAEKIHYLNDDKEKRDRLRDLLKNNTYTAKRNKKFNLEEMHNYFDNYEEYEKETKTELFFGCLWASIKRELEVKCYLDDIIKVAEEKSKNNQYDAICYLIDQKYTYHKNILDNPKDDFIYREEINNIIFDYLQLKVNEISEQQPPQPQPFAPIVPKKPFKWNANKKSLGTLFGVLFNHGIITGNKDDFKRQLITLFEGAPSLSYLNDLINLSSDKTNPNEPVPKYCADTEELLTDWIEFLQDTPTKQK